MPEPNAGILALGFLAKAGAFLALAATLLFRFGGAFFFISSSSKFVCWSLRQSEISIEGIEKNCVLAL